MPVISAESINIRRYWIGEISNLSGEFGEDSRRLEEELHAEILKVGRRYLSDHLRLCGDIPEEYDHDSSEEKLYSKYTDALLSETYKSIGLRSLVLQERADAADVEAFADNYSFVADAKAFRLSRTAKNAKDFKVTSMDVWKRGKPYAMVVCPIYQLPTRASQIYLQATTRNVCIFTYSHMALLVEVAERLGVDVAKDTLLSVFETISSINPSKDANPYWLAVNRAMINGDRLIRDLWQVEKQAALEGLQAAKEHALTYLSQERERIMRMTHEEALAELVRMQRIDSRIRTISNVTDNGLMEIV